MQVCERYDDKSEPDGDTMGHYHAPRACVRHDPCPQACQRCLLSRTDCCLNDALHKLPPRLASHAAVLAGTTPTRDITRCAYQPATLTDLLC